MTEPTSDTADENDIEITYFTRGPVTDAHREKARRMVEALADKAPRPILFARVKMQADEGRTPDDFAVVQSTIDVSGALIRAQVGAPTIEDGLNTLAERMDRRLRTLVERRRQREERPPSTPEGEWRSGDLPTSRPSYLPRPPEERRVVRRKTYAPEASSVEDALFDLDVLDHRFFLFTEEVDGEDAIVYETDDGVRLRKLSGGEPDVDTASGRPLPIDVDPAPAPEMDEEEAQQRLDASREAFVFFREAGSDRGSVMYRRYDGHYGVVEPAT